MKEKKERKKKGRDAVAVGAAFCMRQTNTRAARLTSMTYDRAQANLSITCIEPHRRTSSVTSSNSKRQVSDSYAVLHVSTVVEQRASDYVTLVQPQLIPFFFFPLSSLSLFLQLDDDGRRSFSDTHVPSFISVVPPPFPSLNLKEWLQSNYLTCLPSSLSLWSFFLLVPSLSTLWSPVMALA